MLSRRLGFESLESRRVCAGNVAVRVVSGELRIVGDDAANYVDVQLKTIRGKSQFVVTGVPFVGKFSATGDPLAAGARGATLINHHNKPFVAAANKLAISLHGGNDALVVGGNGTTLTTQSLKATLGTGSDYLRLKSAKVTTAATTVLQTTQSIGLRGEHETGNDKVVIQGFTAAAGAAIFTGGGDDKIAASKITAKALGTKLTVDAGDGNDNFSLAQAKIYDILFTGGIGNDKLTSSTVNFHDATLDTGDGNDAINSSGGIGHNSTISAGNGVDSVTVSSLTLNKVTVNMGSSAERDTMTVQSFTANDSDIDMGAGNNDFVDITSANIKNQSVLKGGAGTGDKLQINILQSLAGNYSITGFEIKPFFL